MMGGKSSKGGGKKSRTRRPLSLSKRKVDK